MTRLMLINDASLDEQIIELYVGAKWSQRKVAALLDITDKHVRARLRANDVHIRTPKEYTGYGVRLTHREIDRTVFLYLQCRMAQREIARYLRISTGTVNYRLRGAGVPMRSKSEANRLYHQRRREHETPELRRVAAA